MTVAEGTLTSQEPVRQQLGPHRKPTSTPTLLPLLRGTTRSTPRLSPDHLAEAQNVSDPHKVLADILLCTLPCKPQSFEKLQSPHYLRSTD